MSYRLCVVGRSVLARTHVLMPSGRPFCEEHRGFVYRQRTDGTPSRIRGVKSGVPTCGYCLAGLDGIADLAREAG